VPLPHENRLYRDGPLAPNETTPLLQYLTNFSTFDTAGFDSGSYRWKVIDLTTAKLCVSPLPQLDQYVKVHKVL